MRLPIVMGMCGSDNHEEKGGMGIWQRESLVAKRDFRRGENLAKKVK
jgi:hypothetical protein